MVSAPIEKMHKLPTETTCWWNRSSKIFVRLTPVGFSTYGEPTKNLKERKTHANSPLEPVRPMAYRHPLCHDAANPELIGQ
jgi:hypothetical protein